MHKNSKVSSPTLHQRLETSPKFLNMQLPTLSIFPNEKKKTKKTEKFPLYARIIFKTKKCEFKLDYDLDLSEYLSWNKKAYLVEKRGSEANIIISRFMTQFNALIDDNINVIHHWNIKDIKKRMSSKVVSQDLTLVRYFETYMDHQVRKNLNFAESTIENYEKAIRHLFSFLNVNKMEGISIAGFEKADAEKLFQYLIHPFPSIGKKTMTEYTASQINRKYATIFKKAVEDDLIKHSPFRNFKFIREYEQKTPLQIHEIKKIIEFDSSTMKDLEIFKDYFLFMFYTGFSISDAIEFKVNQVYNLENGMKCVEGKRKKTKEAYKFILLNQAWEIIEKYADNKTPDRQEFALPRTYDQQLNAKLKCLGAQCEINTRITSHIGRHSINQFIEDAGLTDIDAIFSMMGWGNKKNIRGNYIRISNQRILNFHLELQAKIDEIFFPERIKAIKEINSLNDSNESKMGMYVMR